MAKTPLLETVEAFLDRVGMAPVTFGRDAMNDPHFIRDLRKGRRLWPETEEKVRKFMADYVPPAAATPTEADPAAEAPASQAAA